MSARNENPTRLAFESLPLVEAAVRASFQTAMPLDYRVVFAIREHLKADFQDVKEPSQIEIAPGIGPSPAKFGPEHLPGVVFEGNTLGLRVSIHPQVVVVRWVKRAGPLPLAYPGFAALDESLWKTVEVARQASADEFPTVHVVNMSYLNVLAIPHGPAVVDYFSEPARLRIMSGADQVRKLEASWGVRGGVDIRFAIEQIKVEAEGASTLGYQLTTAAGLRVPASLGAQSALACVHDRLQSFFSELISDKAKQEWKLKESPSASRV